MLPSAALHTPPVAQLGLHGPELGWFSGACQLARASAPGAPTTVCTERRLAAVPPSLSLQLALNRLASAGECWAGAAWL